MLRCVELVQRGLDLRCVTVLVHPIDCLLHDFPEQAVAADPLLHRRQLVQVYFAGADVADNLAALLLPPAGATGLVGCDGMRATSVAGLLAHAPLPRLFLLRFFLFGGGMFHAGRYWD